MPAPRIPPLADDELSDAARAVLAPMLDDDRAWNVFRTMAHHPDLTRRWMVFANHILAKSTLPPRERELAILRIGWLCGSQYEWAQPVVIGTDAGLTATEIDRIGDGPDAEWSDLDRLVLTAADELHHDRRIGDGTWVALAEHWSTQQLMDLVFTVGQYTLVSMALRTFEVPLDDFLTGPDVLGAWDRRD
jgi:alkylhydroperoxidase family enzyme